MNAWSNANRSLGCSGDQKNRLSISLHLFGSLGKASFSFAGLLYQGPQPFDAVACLTLNIRCTMKLIKVLADEYAVLQ